MRTLCFALSLAAAATDLPACNLPHQPLARSEVKSAQTEPAWWVSPAVSGAWFNAGRSGEGVILQMLPNGRVLAIWFTYPPAGEAGEQAWLIAQDGTVDGDTIRFPTVYRPIGARFGAAFDPSQVQLTNWGTLELRFQDCQQATMSWAGPAAWGSGSRAVTRLSGIDQIGCSGGKTLTANGGRAAAGLRSRSGAWYVPERSGEGWIVEELPDGRSIVYWFTYTPDGKQAWTVGSGVREGTRVRIADNRIARGTRFGTGFDPAAVELLPWGTLEIDFASCGAATLSYASTIDGYGSGSRNPVRLSSLAGGACLDQMPAAVTGASWVEKARQPTPYTSELAATVDGNALYALGGFGAPRSLRRFDPVANAWASLPDMPGGRDHLAAFAIDGGIYMVGGAENGGGDQTSAAYRYDLATQTWAARPEIASMYASHAAVLHGQAYIGDGEGNLQQYDPHTRRVRQIRSVDQISRDHSQVVAFLDEIWVVSGRIPETPRVSIWDPASGSWRAGPQVGRARGGFAAAVSGARIVIAGGEVLESNPTFVEPSSEIYNAGATLWQAGPDLPVPVHGVAGGAVGNRVFVISGATRAGFTTGATGRVFELTLPP